MPTCENCLDHHYGTEGEPCGRCKHVADLEAEIASLTAMVAAVNSYPWPDALQKRVNELEAKNDSLRAALEAAAKALEAIDDWSQDRPDPSEAARACWTALGKEW